MSDQFYSRSPPKGSSHSRNTAKGELVLKIKDFNSIKGDAWEARFLGNQSFSEGKLSLTCLLKREALGFLFFLQYFK